MEEYPTPVKIILLLKEFPGLTLDELAEKMSISKMAVLNHISALEQQGAVARKIVKKKVGRPSFIFYALPVSNNKLGNSSDSMLNDFMDFIKTTGYEKLLEEFLKDRYSKVRSEYTGAMRGKNLDEKVNELAILRRNADYYPEVKRAQGNFELIEYNCPILSISKNFGIACSMETKMFSQVLDANVKSTHRQVNGYSACRFLISSKSKDEE
ncbi:helix-turn-helix transcriptional regulator [Ferroplasma acidiphilum]|uniref:helix-turn-helix transcriptional regulator n=1 Tax=Ferroplasma acidiphilum TaxID=74969 RepID=UPI0028165C43|nr:transcriptional regulator [Ferroplasma acidiphilum]WMT52449.1 MAG: transcriptional regulator [Ferroplasma acidiphilum]